MHAIIGKYKVSMGQDELVLTHSVGISFALTVEEALGLLNFIRVYRDTLNVIPMKVEPHTEKTTRDLCENNDDANSLS